MADLIIVNKADGLLLKQAELTKNEYKNASQMISKSRIDLEPRVFTCSSLNNVGLKEIWDFILKFIDQSKKKHIFEENRITQNLKNLWTEVDLILAEYLEKKIKKKEYIKSLTTKIYKNKISINEVSLIIEDYMTKKV